jgi:hypothetical protein
VQIIKDLDAENHTLIIFLIDLGDGAFNKIIAYGTQCNCIEDLNDEILTSEDKAWINLDVIGHQGTLCKFHKD